MHSCRCDSAKSNQQQDHPYDAAGVLHEIPQRVQTQYCRIAEDGYQEIGGSEQQEGDSPGDVRTGASPILVAGDDPFPFEAASAFRADALIPEAGEFISALETDFRLIGRFPTGIVLNRIRSCHEGAP